MSDPIPVGEVKRPEDAVSDSIAWHTDSLGCPADNLLWGHCRDDCSMVLFCMACNMPICILGDGKMADACSSAQSVMSFIAANEGSFNRGPDYEG